MIAYIHVPFCKSRCNYCAFHSDAIGPTGNPLSSPLVRSFVDNLLLEIAHFAEVYPNEKIQSIFFGGGTPSLLPPQIISAILGRIKKGFNVSPKAEITLEANPESLRQRSVLEDYLAAGINRLSMGIQSLDDATLKMLGRPHKAQDGLNAFYLAREAGFANINVDLMWGLPGQSIRQWLQTLKDVERIAPDHISPYCLSLEPGTRIEQQCEAGELVLPPERDQSIMFMQGAAYLEAAGYLHYEISNFARMGFQCRHNLGYWEGASYLGFGPSSTSTIGDKRWTNPANLAAWTETIKRGELGKNPEILSPKTRALELVMLRLRTARGLRLKAYKDMTGKDFLTDHQRFVQTIHENGLVKIRNGYLSLTRSGMLVSNSIISNLFERMKKTLPDDFKGIQPQEPDLDSLAAPDPGGAMPVSWPHARQAGRIKSDFFQEQK